MWEGNTVELLGAVRRVLSCVVSAFNGLGPCCFCSPSPGGDEVCSRQAILKFDLEPSHVYVIVSLHTGFF